MPALPSLTGQLLDGRYYLRRLLGEGAFGVVYLAEFVLLDDVVETVAVKLLSPPTDEARRQVLEEARAMALHSHPNILSFRSAGMVDLLPWQGDVYLVSELAETSLEAYLEANTPMPLDAAMALGRDLAAGLAHLAERKCVHRDLKPANVLRVEAHWKIADFGLARRLESSASHVTSTQGSPLYMAPEAWRGLVTPAVDIWAWGAIMQRCLTGQLPYEKRAMMDEFRARVVRHEPLIVSGMPAPFDELVAACLRKRYGDRPAAVELLRRLEGKAQKEPVAPPISNPRVEGDILVAWDGSGDYDSLREALDAAPSGAVIQVLAGEYRESLNIDKDVTVVGLEDDGEWPVLVHGEGNLLKLSGGQGQLSGLVFEGTAAKNGKRFFGVNVCGGSWRFENCLFRSDSLAAARIAGAHNVAFADCRFDGGASDGLTVEACQHALLERCSLNGNARHGLRLKSGLEGIVQMRGCNVDDNGWEGVLVEDGFLQIQNCHIADNGRSGIQVASGRLEASGSKIVANGGQGVVASRTAAGYVESCDVTLNKYGAWDVPRGVALERRGNKD